MVGGQTVDVAILGGMAMASHLRTDMLSTQIVAGAIQIQIANIRK